jgi:hypothetical protein
MFSSREWILLTGRFPPTVGFMTTTENGSTTAAATQVPVRLDFDARAAGFARAMSHRHTGEVHAFNLSGTREILGTGEIADPGSYTYERAGTTDAWRAVGDQPCVLHLKITGAVQYLDPNGNVTETVDVATQRAAYLTWCAQQDAKPAAQILGSQEKVHVVPE